MNDAISEFDQIATFMAPLSAKAKGAFGLKNDGATFEATPGFETVITTDTLIEGVHFIGDEPAEDIACKALGVNLSDLAAMGACPRYYVLNASYPNSVSSAWLKKFAYGLGLMQEKYDITLLGGDTTATPGPMILSITAIGEVAKGHAISRNGAKPEDLLWVSGTLGDAALGLRLVTGSGEASDPFLISRYHRPEPRVSLGQRLAGVATACLDVSDGFLGDLQHICTASGVGVSVMLENLPISGAALALITKDSDLFSTVLNGGDDYELLFCTPPHLEGLVKKIAIDAACQVTKIGRITTGSTIKLLRNDKPVEGFQIKSYRHF